MKTATHALRPSKPRVASSSLAGRAVLESRPAGWLTIAEIAERTGRSAASLLASTFRGPIIGRWWNGQLLLDERSVASFVARAA